MSEFGSKLRELREKNSKTLTGYLTACFGAVFWFVCLRLSIAELSARQRSCKLKLYRNHRLISGEAIAIAIPFESITEY
jgi:hypothetical protein